MFNESTMFCYSSDVSFAFLYVCKQLLMATEARSFAALSATTPLEPFTFPRRAVGLNDVRIDIKYCGVCSSDLHKVGNEWKNSKYPMVPGHEIVGVVVAVGSDVTKFKVGDAVGVGCLVDSCLSCETCSSGLEQFCEKGALLTYNAVDKEGVVTKGGYSDHIVVRQEFVVRIPENLPTAVRRHHLVQPPASLAGAAWR
jgi:alcohol dehydrogenase (NADP+)